MTNQEISVLVVGDRYIYTGDVETMLRHTRWRVAKAKSIAEALGMLGQQQFHVVLCQHTLQQGLWTDLLEPVGDDDQRPVIIVLGRDGRTALADLCLGAYDVLPIPCDPMELYATVTSAWRHCIHQEQTAARPA